MQKLNKGYQPPNYALKRQILNSGDDICQTIAKDKYILYKYFQLATSRWRALLKTPIPSEITHKAKRAQEDIAGWTAEFGEEYIKEVDRLNHARSRKFQTLRPRIKGMIESGHCAFVTMTFKQSVLDNTTEQTRRTYVARELKGLGVPDYVANIDFGKTTEREHYHAVVQLDKEKFPADFWVKYGYSKIDAVKPTKNSQEALTRYITKLTSHALKNSTKRHHLIYSVRAKNTGDPSPFGEK